METLIEGKKQYKEEKEYPFTVCNGGGGTLRKQSSKVGWSSSPFAKTICRLV